ncbi:MAG: U32 family peptidase [Clostridia bacterium]|nr:U32 family peptidase [Clostridia bacterium]
MKYNNKTPYLLAPAGSYDALCAAIDAGADEVYFGSSGFNARNFAKNFSDEEFFDAIKLCRIFGVRSNITVNTLVYDREINDVLDLIYQAACHGADAFIVQDMGVARAVKEQMPQVALHASTQCACHNKDGAQKFYEAGFSRIVLARELSLEDIISIGKDAPYETEAFVHGALCVSHSGQCLFSSVVGGRSGNRGMCAQPCRMEYEMCGTCTKKGYALSLKDLSLAKHIPALCDAGIASLKIEGRMKSPEYVYGVTKIFKNLLIEKRAATGDEMRALSELFSRDGFTDSYFTKHYIKDGASMYGVRSEKEKELTRMAEKNITIPTPRKNISAVCAFETGKKPSLSFLCGENAVTVTGDVYIEEAKNAGATFDSVAKNIAKLGNTHFALNSSDISMTLSENAFVPAGLLNEMRRTAAEKLELQMTEEIPLKRCRMGFVPVRQPEKEKQIRLRLYFASCENFEKKLSAFKNVESVVFPLGIFAENSLRDVLSEICRKYKVGVLFPRVLFESERQTAYGILCSAAQTGASFCEVSNIGHISAARDAGLKVYGGIGLNITNTLSVQYYTEVLGLESVVLSPEMKLGAMRDIPKSDAVTYCAYAYGRYPLMVLENCLLRSRGMCDGKCSVCGILHDRIGADFPIYASPRLDAKFPCRNIIYNSVITDLRTKKDLYTAGLDILCISAEEDGMPM